MKADLKAIEQRARELGDILCGVGNGEASQAAWKIANDLSALTSPSAETPRGEVTDAPTVEQTIESIVRDCCETEPAPVDDEDTVCIDVDQLRLIVQFHVDALSRPKPAGEPSSQGIFDNSIDNTDVDKCDWCGQTECPLRPESVALCQRHNSKSIKSSSSKISSNSAAGELPLAAVACPVCGEVKISQGERMCYACHCREDDAAIRTQDEMEAMQPAEEYITWLWKMESTQKGSTLTDRERTLIAGNIRSFHRWLRNRTTPPIAPHDKAGSSEPTETPTIGVAEPPGSAGKTLAQRGVFKNADCFERWAECDEFWDRQMYGTRFYFGPNGNDYIQRGILSAAVKALAELSTPTTPPDAPALNKDGGE